MSGNPAAGTPSIRFIGLIGTSTLGLMDSTGMNVDAPERGASPRPPEVAMRLARMGAAFPTRLSFMRSLIRLMHRERWRVEAARLDLDDEGYGVSVHTVTTPRRRYSLVGCSHHLAPERRTDRVIAEAWDATFSLFDGVPAEADVRRLAAETPRQEAGRYLASELVLSRANKSVRLFTHVVDSLARGRQPDPALLGSIGYLMRTTAVYGNGKFGMSDRARYADRPELAGPFRAELLSVYLIRCFTFDLVEHLARRRNPEGYARLDPRLKRHLGIGNATGLGMAPFLVSHPVLIHRWFSARETALARVRALRDVTAAEAARFRALLHRARRHVDEWQVEDAVQSGRIAKLRDDLRAIDGWIGGTAALSAREAPWDRLYRRAAERCSVEGQELLASLLIEPYGSMVDALAEGLEDDREERFDPAMTAAEMRGLIGRHYGWALAFDFFRPEASRYFWYYSEEKIEPRRGERRSEPGADREMPIAVARDVGRLAAALDTAAGDETLASFLARHPELRHVARRVQIGALHPYAEIRDNLIGADCRPIDLLRAKLACFGASKFDPKSDLWTRITLYQGAPLPDRLHDPDADDWCFPVFPAAACTSR